MCQQNKNTFFHISAPEHLILGKDMEKDVMLLRSYRGFHKISAIFCCKISKKNTPFTHSSNTFFYGLVHFIYLFGRLFAHFNSFWQKLFNLLFKSSSICRIFRDPGSPRLPLFSRLLLHPQGILISFYIPYD